MVAGLAPYPAAAVMAATGVAGVAVNRSITGDCWGSCGAHRMCEHDSGLCVPQPCGGDCRIDEVCVNERCELRRKEQPAPDANGAHRENDDRYLPADRK